MLATKCLIMVELHFLSLLIGKSHFDKPYLIGDFLNEYIEKVDVRKYLSREGYNYLIELLKKLDPDYAKIMLDSILDDNLAYLLRDKGI